MTRNKRDTIRQRLNAGGPIAACICVNDAIALLDAADRLDAAMSEAGALMDCRGPCDCGETPCMKLGAYPEAVAPVLAG